MSSSRGRTPAGAQCARAARAQVAANARGGFVGARLAWALVLLLGLEVARAQEGAPPSTPPATPPAQTPVQTPAQEPVPAPAVPPVTAPPQEPVPAPNPEPTPTPAPAQPTPTAPTPTAPTPTAPAELAWEPRYHAFDDVRALCASWAAAAPARGLVLDALTLAPTHGGLAAPVLRFGRSGGEPLAQRPVIVLLGGADGVSLTGCEAVLAIVARVFEKPDELPAGVTFLAIPWASPDALARTLAGPSDGRDARPVDDDGDQRADEDGPDDIDGDGHVLTMLVEDPAGPWMRASDPRFVIPARAGESPRYRLVPEGRDDDGDGEYNEDPVGGSALCEDFPVEFEPRGSLATGLTLPLESEHARALAALLAETRPWVVLAFQGAHGGLAWPARARDESAAREPYQALAHAFSQATGRVDDGARTLTELGRPARAQSALRWMREGLGALTAEVSLWGPQVERPLGEGNAAAGLSPATARLDGSELGAPNVGERAPIAADRAWARWLDDLRGGIGFVEWHPVDLGPGTRALVGGWLPFTRRNAPERSLAAALAPAANFALRVAALPPRYDLVLDEVRRDGELCFVRARLASRAGIACTACTERKDELTLRLALPPGARLMAGAETNVFATPRAGELTRELAWIVLAPAGSSFALSLDQPWGGRTSWEVKP